MNCLAAVHLFTSATSNTKMIAWNCIALIVIASTCKWCNRANRNRDSVEDTPYICQFRAAMPDSSVSAPPELKSPLHNHARPFLTRPISLYDILIGSNGEVGGFHKHTRTLEKRMATRWSVRPKPSRHDNSRSVM